MLAAFRTMSTTSDARWHGSTAHEASVFVDTSRGKGKRKKHGDVFNVFLEHLSSSSHPTYESRGALLAASDE